MNSDDVVTLLKKFQARRADAYKNLKLLEEERKELNRRIEEAIAADFRAYCELGDLKSVVIQWIHAELDLTWAVDEEDREYSQYVLDNLTRELVEFEEKLNE